MENAILTKYTKGKGISYSFGEEKKNNRMLMSDSEFLSMAKQIAGNDIKCLEIAEALWSELGDIPINEDEELEEDFNPIGHYFGAGTDRYDVWQWFENYFNLSVAKDLMKVG